MQIFVSREPSVDELFHERHLLSQIGTKFTTCTSIPTLTSSSEQVWNHFTFLTLIGTEIARGAGRLGFREPGGVTRIRNFLSNDNENEEKAVGGMSFSSCGWGLR